MKKQVGNLIFVLLCLVICLIPLCGMLVKRTEATTEKRTLAEWPQWTRDDGSFNTEYLQEAGAYFNDHFALKNEVVAADSLVMSKLFRQSTVDTVLVGTDDWLYYTSSLNDYTGTDVVSPRGAYNIAHNLRIVQDRMEQEGIDFAITVAPNKNSLYDENMPYHERVKSSQQNNRSLVVPLLQQLDVSYIDLYGPFQDQDEVLYRKQDSHWNQKGAVLAYGTVTAAFKKTGTDYTDAEITRIRTEAGDLATALYSVAAKPEWDYRYEQESQFSYVTDTESWEDYWIQTEAPGKTGNLLMFRDSFGNTLSPLIAQDYARAAFSKDTIYHLEPDVQMCEPDTVLFEIVERNFWKYGAFSPTNFNCGPPLMEAPAADVAIDAAKKVDSDTTLQAEISGQHASYLCLSGSLDERYMDTETDVYVEVNDGTDTVLYEAYTTTDPDTGADNGYMMYLNLENHPDAVMHAKVYVRSADGTMQQLLEQDIQASIE